MIEAATMIPFTAKAPKRALVEAMASKSAVMSLGSESDLGGGDEWFHDRKGSSRCTFVC